MAQQYTTKNGDVLDLLCSIQYPKHDWLTVTMEVYEANPGLAAHGPILPQGLKVLFPDIKETKRKTIPVVKFWA